MAVKNKVQMPPGDREIVKSNMSSHAFLPFGQMKRSTRNFSFFIVALLFFSGFSTYFILLNLTPVVPTREVVVTVLLINAALVIVMLAIILGQVRRLYIARTRGMAGSQLHIKLVMLFSAIAAFPLLLMALFASFSLDKNLDHWFSKPIKNIVRSSLGVTRIYVVQNGALLARDSQKMAREFGSTSGIARTNPKKYQQLLQFLAPLHNIDSAYIVDNFGNVTASYLTKNRIRYRFPNQTVFRLANGGKPVVVLPGLDRIPKKKGVIFYLSPRQDGIVRSVVKLEKLDNTYLYTQALLDPDIVSHIATTRNNVDRYSMLQKRKGGYQVAFALMYIVIALTLLLAVVWVGFWFSDKMVDPIRRLIAAAKKVSDGNLSASVSVSASQGELADLGTMFNNMTTQLRMQRNELTDATAHINAKRRFTEAVLSGVTAGVVGLDGDRVVTLVNRSAGSLLPHLDIEDTIGRDIGEVLPEFAPLVDLAGQEGKRESQDNINLVIDTHERSFAVKVTREHTGEIMNGYVITLDDITELLSAQKTAAWADVAQRVAHEIKNPLTPIQLSAERLKRKYGKVLEDDRGAFAKCTDTIVRHVGDIGRMVTEFSDFAKISAPVLERNDVRDVVRDGMMIFKMAHPGIGFEADLPEQPLVSLCDRAKLGQAIVNLVKNASEAIEARAEKEDNESYRGQIRIVLSRDNRSYRINIVDNGCGFPGDGDMDIHVTDKGSGLPKEKRNKLFEPYITTRVKGTGLGLSIVKKTIEQHHGTISLNDAKDCGSGDRGACVTIDIPIMEPDNNRPAGRGREELASA